MRVVVAYASKNGSTAEVAEAVARRLGERGLEVDVRPVAIFALGPKTAEERDLAESRSQLDRALRGVEHATVAVFGGVIDPTKLRFPFNRMPPSDPRDWDAIAAWADEVAEAAA